MSNRVGRTALVLAFGEHPGHCCGLRYEADKAFFRGAVLPFLDEHAVSRAQKVLVIHEFNVGYDLSGMSPENPEHLAGVRGVVEKMEEHANAVLRGSLDCGIMPDEYQSWLDWGYLERIIEINRAAPGRIRNIIEPLSDSTVWRMWDQTLTCNRTGDAGGYAERVELEMEIIRHSIEICLGRSRRVSALVKEIREKEPETAIIVPRGYAHKGMAVDFDFSEFEMRVSYGLRGVPHFSSEAIAESFARKLSEGELMRYAVLSIRFDEYIRKARTMIRPAQVNGGQITLERLLQMNAEARRYALGLEHADQQKLAANS
jgi:hypothetical protein